MMGTKLLIQKGKTIPAPIIKQISKILHKTFPGDPQLKPTYRKPFVKDIFFILFNAKNKILAVGRLTPVKINFLGKTYSVQGIADIVSTVRKKGYGGLIMFAIRKYLQNTEQTAVGFCSSKNSGFYRKCKFKIYKNLAQRFVYRKGKIIKTGRTGGEDVLYFSKKDKFIEKVLANPKKEVPIPRGPW